MNGGRSNRSLDDSDLERREPVWKALSTLWLAREPTPRDLAWIAGVLNDSGFAVAALRDIYLYEVAPVVYRNLGAAFGEHDAFDEPRLYSRAKRRAEHRSAWLRLWVASGLGRRRMTATTDPYWNIVIGLLERMRNRARDAAAKG